MTKTVRRERQYRIKDDCGDVEFYVYAGRITDKNFDGVTEIEPEYIGQHLFILRTRPDYALVIWDGKLGKLLNDGRFAGCDGRRKFRVTRSYLKYMHNVTVWQNPQAEMTQPHAESLAPSQLSVQHDPRAAKIEERMRRPSDLTDLYDILDDQKVRRCDFCKQPSLVGNLTLLQGGICCGDCYPGECAKMREIFPDYCFR